MRRLTFWLIVIPLYAVFSNTAMANNSGETVHICDDDGEWAPFAYFRREGSKKTTQPTGFTVELTQVVFSLMKEKHTYELIPWKRCLREVHEFGKRRRFEMVTNASFNQERAAKYHISDPIYSITPGFFYSRERFQNGSPIKVPTDLNKYQLCGVRGYNFSMYHELGIKKKIDKGPARNLHALKKVSRGNCDFFLSLIEPVQGLKLLQPEFPDNLASQKLMSARMTEFFFFSAKTSPRGQELIEKVNRALKNLKQSGKYKKLYQKYLK